MGMKRAFWATCLAATFIVACATVASADDLLLKFVTLDNPDAHHNVRVQHPWAERINQQAHGLFRIQIFDGSSIANQLNVYNRVLDDVVQIAWGLPDLATGKFKLTQVVELPYLTNNSEEASVAFWRLYKTGLLDSDFDQIVPLKLIIFPQSGMQFREKPATLDNLNGLKIVVGSKITSEVAAALGGAPLAFPINQYYEVLQRGTADAVQIGWTAFQPFKLAEVTKYHLDVPLGSAPGYVFMAKKKFDSLPPEAQKILMANAGEQESRQFGKFWDDVNNEWRDATLKLPGHTALKLTPAQDKAWHERVETVANDWAKSQPGGEKLLATYRQILADVRAGK
jgi:TRAP-type C4-dicarboxylate transport system substrate-binding protein